MDKPKKLNSLADVFHAIRTLLGENAEERMIYDIYLDRATLIILTETAVIRIKITEEILG